MFRVHRRAIKYQQQRFAGPQTNHGQVVARRNFLTSNKKNGNNNNSKPKDGEQVRKSSFTAESGRQGAKEEANQQTKQENIFNRFSAWYSHKLETHPLITKSITGGLIAASGDTICQFGTFKHGEGKKGKDGSEPSSFREVYDPMRSVHFYMMGAFFAAPLNHVWFNYLSKKIPGQTFGPISKRVGLDQLIWTPTWTVAWMAIFWTMEGTEPSDIPQGLKENYPSVITANWVLWIPAQYINFYFTPLKYQVLFTNFIELMWNTYLSFANAEREKPGSSEKDISTDDDKTEEEKERELRRQSTQTLHRRRTFR